jgi:hypothetical protein
MCSDRVSDVFDPQVLGPKKNQTHDKSSAEDSTEDLEKASVAPLIFEKRHFLYKFYLLHLKPWELAAVLGERVLSRKLVLTAFAGMFVFSWLGEMLSWNFGGREEFVSNFQLIESTLFEQLSFDFGPFKEIFLGASFLQMQLYWVLSPFLTVLPLVLWAALTAVGLKILGVVKTEIFFRVFLLGVFVQWVNVWKAVPVTGGFVVLFAKFVLSVYLIKKIFELSLSRAILSMYVLPLIVFFVGAAFLIVFSLAL